MHLFAQGLNVLLLAPVWLQLVHLLVAELFWIVVVLASANLAFVPLPPIKAMSCDGDDPSTFVRTPPPPSIATDPSHPNLA